MLFIYYEKKSVRVKENTLFIHLVIFAHVLAMMFPTLFHL